MGSSFTNKELAEALKQFSGADPVKPAQLFVDANSRHVLFIKEENGDFHVIPMEWDTAVFMAEHMKIAAFDSLRMGGMDGQEAVNKICDYAASVVNRVVEYRKKQAEGGK